uniref:Helicase ATP-binding domain-containing protein n=1 Tax=Caenorhabditis tropicalis TaxID=1561998 RepID=A0A1I7UEH8_9PELO
MKVVEDSEDDADLQVIDDEDLQLAAEIEKERKEKRAQKLREKREKEGKPVKKETRKRGKPPTKKRRVDSSEEEDEDEDEESPKKPVKKARRRAKDSEDDDSEDEMPKKSSKKTKKRAESSDEDDEEEERSRKKPTRKAGKRAKSSDEDEDSEEDKRKKKKNEKKRKSRKQKSESEESEESDDDDDRRKSKNKKKKTSKKRAETSESEESDYPKRKKSQKKRRDSSSSESESESEEDRKMKKKKNKKKISKKRSVSSEPETTSKKKKSTSKKRGKESSDEESEEEQRKTKKNGNKRGKSKSSEEESDGEKKETQKNKKQEKKDKKEVVDSKEEEEEEEIKEDKQSTSEEKESVKSDSEDDIVISPKRKTKKQEASDEQSEESEEEVMPKKKSRGVVLVSDEEDSDYEQKKKNASGSEESDSTGSEASEASDSDEKSTKKKSKKEEKSKKKKKGMIMDDSKLAKSTVDAEKAERERRKRLEKKQKEFNGIVLNEKAGLEQALEGKQISWLKSVVLDPDANSDPPVPVEVHKSLVRILKPHQAHGVQFMYDCAFESVDRLDSEGSGGILAHCMGLGKTLQVITFLHTTMMHEKVGEKCRRVLVVVPKNVIINWFKECQKWLEDNDPELGTIEYDEMDRYKSIPERLYALKQWHKTKTPSVMIIGYDMFRILTCEDDPKKKKTAAARKLAKAKEEFRKYLQDPGPDMVVCDEAHKLKNDESALSKCMVKIATKRRICLTGTPLQNNLMEYHCMVNFVKPGLLGTKTEFANRFSNIITRGRTKDASPLEVSFMKRRCHVLYEHLKKCVDRKDYSVLTEAIPPKQEYVVNVRMTEKQCSLYNLFLEDVVGSQGLSKRLLPDYHMFSRIWTHPYQLILHEQRLERERVLRDEEEEEAAFIDDEESEEEDSYNSSSSEESVVQSGSDSDDGKKRKRTRRTRRKRKGRRKQEEINGIRQSRRLAGEDALERDTDTPPEYTGWFAKSGLLSDDDRNDFTLSNKLVLLMEIIKKCEEIGDKLLVFSQSLESLALIKRMLEHMAGTGQWFGGEHAALNAEGEEAWSWLEGTDYMTIDGSVQSVKRDSVQTEFNDPQNLRARLMLISTRAGSLGTNMVAANRVVIFDACWNPSHDTQSLFRVYRFGQTKPVYIYRFIAQGTMEERIYKRQVTKESTSMRVVDEAQIQRHYLGNDLTELYQFTPSKYDPEIAISCAPPKDLLLAEVIHENPSAIVDYIEHDTLFANQEQEKLTEQEMKDAWADYEKDKSGQQPPPLPRVQYDVNAIRSGGVFVGPQLETALQNRFQETLRIDQLQNDPLYRELTRMRNKDLPTFLKVVLLRNLLEQILPYIPDEMRGGMSEFNSHFIRLVHESDRKMEAPEELLRKALESFKTVTRMVSGIPTCREPMERMRRTHPYLFE